MKEYIVRYETEQIENSEFFYGGKVEYELIRCKDCYFYIDGYCDNNVIYQMMSGDLIGVHFEPHEDFYCANAERKEE